MVLATKTTMSRDLPSLHRPLKVVRLNLRRPSSLFCVLISYPMQCCSSSILVPVQTSYKQGCQFVYSNELQTVLPICTSKQAPTCYRLMNVNCVLYEARFENPCMTPIARSRHQSGILKPTTDQYPTSFAKLTSLADPSETSCCLHHITVAHTVLSKGNTMNPMFGPILGKSKHSHNQSYPQIPAHLGSLFKDSK